MDQKEVTESNRLRLGSLRTARLGFAFIGIYIFSTAIYQAWRLLTPDVIQTRWFLAIAMISINATLWWYSHKPRLRTTYYRTIIFLQIAMYIVIATYSIYVERGMASNSIILYAIPLVIVALEYSGRALAFTALICSTAYAAAAIHYFNTFPSEGYKVELYGGIAFYSGIMFVLAALLWVVVRARNISSS